MSLKIEIWSDVVCPWCYIGKRRFERAVAELATADGDEPPVEVDYEYRAFQLDPGADPDRSGPVFDSYAKKFGGPEQAQQIIDKVTATAADEGLEFRMDIAQRANTRRAHRLIWLAGRLDSPVDQHELKERLMQAYFHDGLDIGDRSVLADLAAEIGFDRGEIVEFLASDAGEAEVTAELAAAGEHGITGVPTFVIHGQWAIPGAQDTETFVRSLRKVAANLG